MPSRFFPVLLLVLLLVPTLSPLTALIAQVPNPAPSDPSEIEVDRTCRIASTDLSDPAQPRIRHHYDSGICRLDGGVSRSIQWEKTIRNGASKEVSFEVVEREFLLHNPYPAPVTFIVKEQLGKHYRINSDPPPTEVTGSIATFRVVAQPNQTIRLHVGERD